MKVLGELLGRQGSALFGRHSHTLRQRTVRLRHVTHGVATAAYDGPSFVDTTVSRLVAGQSEIDFCANSLADMRSVRDQ